VQDTYLLTFSKARLRPPLPINPPGLARSAELGEETAKVISAAIASLALTLNSPSHTPSYTSVSPLLSNTTIFNGCVVHVSLKRSSVSLCFQVEPLQQLIECFQHG